MLPNGRADRVLGIDAQGTAHRLLSSTRIVPHPISVAARSDTGEILVDDNLADVVNLR